MPSNFFLINFYLRAKRKRGNFNFRKYVEAKNDKIFSRVKRKHRFFLIQKYNYKADECVLILFVKENSFKWLMAFFF